MERTRAADQKMSLLIIDDDEDDYQILCDLLQDIENGSFDITWEHCYDSGLARLHTCKFDVCLAGYCVGGRTGTDFVRAASRVLQSCPIILMSGVMCQGLDAAANGLGAAGLLDKSKLTSEVVEASLSRAVSRMSA